MVEKLRRRTIMRTWILSAVLAASALGLIGLTPAESQAQWGRPRLYYPYYPGYVYYPPIQSYYRYPAYSYPAYSYSSSYYAPSPYVAPAYNYSYSYYTPPTYYRSYGYSPYYYAPTYYYP
jgi:hypothetical protein